MITSPKRGSRRPANSGTSHIRRSVGLLLVVIFGVVGACGGAQPGATTVATTASATTVPATTNPVETTAPAPDLSHPVGVIAMGHSGLTGEGTGGAFQPVKANSWATGDSPEVNSVYLRLVSALPDTEGHVYNAATGGAGASTLLGQTELALSHVPVPLLSFIQTVDNDIMCDGSNVSDVGASLAEALERLHTASPNGKIMVVGQLGRPSVAYIEELVAAVPAQKANLTWNDDCSFFDADGNLSEPGVQKLSDVIDEYEAETARVCAEVPNCVTDGGVRKAWIDELLLP